MNKDLKLSIIVPVYNVEQYLQECIDSLYQQDIPIEDYEIILINDGSTDSSYELAKQIDSMHENIRLLTQTNQGQSVARNKGLDIARGKYIMFVDSDDGLFPNVIGTILETAENKKLDVCAYRISYLDEQGEAHYGSIQPFDTDKVYNGRYAVTHGADIGAIWLNLYSKEMIEKFHLRFLEGIYHQDVDFNLRMYAYADKIMFTNIIAYNYRFVAGSSTRKPNKKRIIKLLNDDMIVVHHIRDFSMKDEHGKLLRDFYIKHGNSLLVSCLINLYKEKRLNYNDKISLFEKAKTLHIYPIKGRTLSWKTTLISQILNVEWIYKKLLQR